MKYTFLLEKSPPFRICKCCNRWILQHPLKENVLEKSGRKIIDEVLFKSYHNSCKFGVLEKGGADRVISVQWKYDLCLYKIGALACERDKQLMLVVFWVHILYSRLCLFRSAEQKHCLSLNLDWITPSSFWTSSWIWRQCVCPKFRDSQITLHLVLNQKTKIIRSISSWPTSKSLRPEFCWSCAHSCKIFLAENSALNTTKVEILLHKRFKYRKLKPLN
jgi:hypothetical protein